MAAKSTSSCDAGAGGSAGAGTGAGTGRTLTSDSRVEAAIGLLAALTSSDVGCVSAQTARRDLALDDDQLNEVIATLQAVADTRTGARAIVYRSGDDVVLQGSAGELKPLRLTADEALAVRQVLARYQLDDDVRERVERALMPTADTNGAEEDWYENGVSQLAGDSLFGGFYQRIIEAIQDGVRCCMWYRADADEKPVARVIDPGFIEVAHDAAYLIAWNVDKDAQRRYRLDRVADIQLTDDSVERHPFQRRSMAESLREGGSMAGVAFASRDAAEACDWAGLDLRRGRALADGAFAVPVHYATESWLFDQVLAAGGSIRIVEPRALRERFCTYAETLLRG